MRALFLAVSVALLAGCATKQETAAFNATLYNRCVAEAARTGMDATKECGISAAGYRPSFGDRYSYFRDQRQEQVRQEAVAVANDPNATYMQCYAAMLAQPTRTGSLAETMSTAELVCSGRVPYSATRPTPPKVTNCESRPHGRLPLHDAVRTIVALGRVATMFVVSAGLFSGIILFGIGCAAVPVGIAWDIATWAVSGHWAVIGATQRLMQSHFVWGAAVGAGIAKLWHESEDWAAIARTPILGSLFGHVTMSADHRDAGPDQSDDLG